MCAERVAFFKPVSEGETANRAFATVSEPGLSLSGACRQVLREFGDVVLVVLGIPNGAYRCFSINQLLPEEFGSEASPG